MEGSISIGGSVWATGVSYRVNVSRPTVDASVFGDKWQLNLAGLPTVEGSFEGLYNAGGDTAWAASLLGRVTVTLYAYGGSVVASGPAYVFSGVSSSVTDAVRVSGTFKGSGEWSIAGQYLP
jgi:hypothetical protein